MTTDIRGVLRAEGELRAVHLDRVYDTDITDLWSALTDRDRLARWFARVDGELALGAAFRILFDEEQTTDGTVLACREPDHLRISWTSDGESESYVRVDLSTVEEGTRLRLDHTRLPLSGAAGYAAGWHTYLDQLAADLRGDEAQGSTWDARWQALLPAYQAQLRS